MLIPQTRVLEEYLLLSRLEKLEKANTLMVNKFTLITIIIICNNHRLMPK